MKNDLMTMAEALPVVNSRMSFAGFRSGSGGHQPSWLKSQAAFHGLRFALALEVLETEHEVVGHGSSRMQKLSRLMRRFRVEHLSDLRSWRCAGLSLICPAADGVRWEPVERGGVPGWLCVPDNIQDDSSAFARVIHAHGGGLSSGDASCVQGYLSHFAWRIQRPVECVHYRLCPESTKEDAVEDFAKYLEAACEAGQRRLVVTADSGGGYVAHHALVENEMAAAATHHVVLMSPMLGAVPLDECSDKDDALASLTTYQFCYELARIKPPQSLGLSPDGFYAHAVTIFACESEVLGGDARLLCTELQELGVPVTDWILPGHLHAWPVLQGLSVPEMDLALNIITEIVLKTDVASLPSFVGLEDLGNAIDGHTITGLKPLRS